MISIQTWVVCDKCCFAVLGLTRVFSPEIAMDPAFVKRELEESGWAVIDGEHICEDCLYVMNHQEEPEEEEL